MTRIAALDAWPLDVPLTKPFGIAGGAQEVARNAIVRATLEDGTAGHGEAAPFPAFNGETQERALREVAAAAARVVGLDDAGAVAEAARPLCGSARCAIETAFLDARARSRGEAIFAHGGRSLVTDVTIPIGPLDECARDAAAWVARGFTRLKVKIGGAGADEAIARVLAVHDAAPRAELLLDGNAGLDADGAIAVVRALDARGARLALFEQPVAKGDLDGLARVARDARVLVAADESAASDRDVERLARLGVPLVVNVKPMKYGFDEAARIHALARRAGLGLMIGGMVEGVMAMSASACFAAALGGFDFVDLDTPLFMAGDVFEGGWRQDGPRLDLAPITRGHGVVPRDARS